MKFGDYTVRVTAPGFTVSREDVALSASEPVRNRRRAAPAKPRAGDPSGAVDSRDPRRSGRDRPFRARPRR